MKTLALLSLLVVVAPVLASDGVGPYAFTLSGKGFDERCLKLAAGESIRYRFSASAPVDFNIHYHRGKDVFFPVKQTAVREASSTFRADSADDFCLMWEHAGPGTATVEGHIERASGR